MNSHLLRPGALLRAAARALAVSALVLAAWGCRDSTGPAANPDDGAVPRLGHASAFYCSTRAIAPNGVREGRIPLNFPPEARSADGSTMEYRAQWQTPSGVVSYTADCVIPRTISAVEIMNQRFQVPAELGMPKGRNRSGSEITIQGCVEDGECILEPIVVVAPPPPTFCTIYCGGGGGGGISPGYTGGAGGSSGDGGAYLPPDSPGDDTPSNPSVPDCAQAVDSKELAWCNGWGPAGEFRKRVDDALARIAQRGTECIKLADKAKTLLGNQTFRFTDVDYAGWGAAAPLGGDWVILDRSWVDSDWSERNLDYIISHEMDHSVGNVIPGITDSQGHLLKSDGSVDAYHTANSRQCAGLL